MASIHIDVQQIYRIPALDIATVRNFAQSYLKEQKFGQSHHIECEIRFVDSDTIHQLNARFREKNTSTDVLSFPLWDKPQKTLRDAPLHIGSIVINGETIQNGARINHRSVTSHVCVLIKHSIRHLMGRHHSE
ncbi:rRNA maturation RNase YbeY [Candidatus Berkelbacteria bacterium CG10_big_fil_rev_8_21_14_0_10_43_14]|uniref:rRNA maturation RNase YbeY n=1 Tax=Candidatus Berkelbacteria bacterium CG10_big_fil_rev_8_21_14_0_10_43_14 TaxID=1974515 RepID=A0A2M6R9G5_9BACT|nr:MAG: rRNA maturation RNase YbeY [Candidatus Berkelbacteria bacterium CG10_big_fil_rev_8_21_14_0_10_43_14]